MDEFKLILKNELPIAFALQETHLLPKDSVQVNNYQVFRQDFCDGLIACGGVMIVVHNSCHAQRITVNHSSNLQIVAVRIISNKIKQNFTLCNLYNRPGNSSCIVKESDFSHITSQLPKPFILAGDFNGHSTLWGSYKLDTQGKEIEKFFRLNDVYLLNRDVPTHVNNTYGTLSAIDLTFVSPALATEVTWSPLDDTYSSDHFPIHIKFLLDVNFDEYPKSDPKWLFKKAKWDIYQSLISFHQESEQPICPLGTNIDQILSLINKNILDAAHASIPVLEMKSNRKYTPWWNNELKNLIKARKKALKTYKRNPIRENFVQYKVLRSQVRLKIKENKKKSWIGLMDTIKYNLDSKTMWDHMKRFRGKQLCRTIPAIKNKDDEIIKDQLEISNLLVEHFCSVSSNEKYNPAFRHYKNIKEKQPVRPGLNSKSRELNLPFSLDELTLALKGCKSFACGPDNICYPMLMNLPEEALTYVLKVYNVIWTNGVFPDSWKASSIVPVLKPNKNALETTSYRPIALMSCSCKILEKMINRRLTWHLDKYQLINKFQSGSRRQRSTVDNLLVLEDEICHSINNKQVTAAVLLDIETAYNRVWGRKVLEKLSEWDIGGPMFQYLTHFLNNNYVIVKCKSYKSSLRKIENGIKQGSSLSCNIFSIATCDLSDYLHPSVKHVMYVDDFGIFISGRDVDDIKQPLQLSLKNLQTWTRINGLDFSAAKTCGIIFSRRWKRNTRPPKLIFKGVHVNFEDSIKWLGVWLDRRFTFEQHVKYTKTKGQKALNILKILSHPVWGLNRKLLLRIYQAYVRPIIDYGCILYDSASDKLLQKLEPVQNAALRCIMGAFRSSPVSSLQAESGQMPLKYRRKQLIINYASKLKCNPLNPVHSIVFNTDRNQVYNFDDKKPKPLSARLRNIHSVNIDSLHPVCIKTQDPPWTLNIPEVEYLFNDKKINISSAECTQKFLKYLNERNDFAPCFTDGSKCTDSTSCAFVYENKPCKIKLNSICSVFTAEMFAIHFCLEHISKTYPRPKDKFIVFSDSKSALQCLLQPFPTNPICLNIRSLLLDLKFCHGIEILFTWIPSHHGISGNVLVDTAANEAHTTPDVNVQEVTADDIKSTFKRAPLAEWKNEWQATPITNKLRYIKDNVKPWSSSNRHNRREEVVLSRLRIGHTSLTHGHLMEKKDPPQCSSCMVPLTVYHILSVCPMLEDHRKKVRLRSKCLKWLLSDSDDIASQVIRFLRISKLFNKL
ncbi:hypothetical protein M8J77_005465 [Diaphorina citri]|nr:hypothetical protein M8J77_005465 [Diaphorina citri]